MNCRENDGEDITTLISMGCFRIFENWHLKRGQRLLENTITPHRDYGFKNLLRMYNR